MNDFYSVVTEMLKHSYSLYIIVGVMLIPIRMLAKSFHGKFPL